MSIRLVTHSQRPCAARKAFESHLPLLLDGSGAPTMRFPRNVKMPHISVPPASPEPPLPVDTSHDPGTVPSALDAEPTTRVRAPWITGFVFAGLGWQVASQVPTTFTVPQQIKDIDPGGHVADFALVNSIGTLSILFLGPLFGMLSDRTVSRFGRRRPWIAFGGLAAAAALLFSGTQNSVWGVGLGYLLQAASVAALAAGMVTIVPDRVPVGQRGVVLGWGGVPQAAALIVGGVLVSLSKGYVGQYAALASLMVFVVLFAWRVGDRPLPRSRREPFSFQA